MSRAMNKFRGGHQRLPAEIHIRCSCSIDRPQEKLKSPHCEKGGADGGIAVFFLPLGEKADTVSMAAMA